MESMAVAAMADAHVGDGNAQLYHDVSLSAPEVDFIVDENSLVHSNMEVTDQIMYLEQRLQMQEDEVQLLKIALADVIKRLNISEAQTAAHTKRRSVKASRPVSLALLPRTTTNTSNPVKKSSSSTLPSSTSSKNYSPLQASKRGAVGSPKNCSSVPASRCPAPTTSTTSSPCKKLQASSKPKETITTSVIGNRHVTHCKVTVQIYLSHLTKKTGPTENPVSTAVLPSVCPPDKADLDKRKVSTGRKPGSQSIHRSTCPSPLYPAEIPIYRSPIKSPSQYFQICY